MVQQDYCRSREVAYMVVGKPKVIYVMPMNLSGGTESSSGRIPRRELIDESQAVGHGVGAPLNILLVERTLPDPGETHYRVLKRFTTNAVVRSRGLKALPA